MKRFLTVVMVLVLVLGITHTVLAKGKPIGAGARKVLLYDSEDYSCTEGATDLTGDVYGFVMLNTNRAGDLIVMVSLKRATPNEEYDIYVGQEPGACPLEEPTVEDGLRTNRMGNGNGYVKVPIVEGATKFWVTVYGGGLTLRSTAVELD